MARILRGDIYWADLNPVIGSEQGGLRPVLILSQNVFNERSGTVIAVALTSQPQRAGYPLTLELIGTKLPKKSWVKISQIRTLSIKRIS
ncbi:MAG: type II toxin-antitoxin system PemK/MazF family toxin, partial [Pseudomonadota bacterium]